MELALSIISCVAAVGSLIVAIISLFKTNANNKEINKLKAKNVVLTTENNEGIIIGLNSGDIKNEKK